MAKITRQTKSNRGKEVRCEKCGKVIAAGMEYLKATPFRRSPIIRCLACGLMPYETSSSEYIRTVGEIVEKWKENYTIDEETANNIAADLEDVKSGCEESLDNIPENLRDGDAGSMLQERIDTLESVISGLEDISFEDFRDEAREEILEEDDSGYDYDESPDDEGDRRDWVVWKDEIDNLTHDRTSEKYQNAIDESLSSLEY